MGFTVNLFILFSNLFQLTLTRHHFVSLFHEFRRLSENKIFKDSISQDTGTEETRHVMQQSEWRKRMLQTKTIELEVNPKGCSKYFKSFQRRGIKYIEIFTLILLPSKVYVLFNRTVLFCWIKTDFFLSQHFIQFNWNLFPDYWFKTIV